ncbi:MAG: hypothetical protein H7838_05240 [Magnetococcus sp. DMHC-8]
MEALIDKLKDNTPLAFVTTLAVSLLAFLLLDFVMMKLQGLSLVFHH